MDPGQGELHLFFFDAVLASHGVHPQPPLHHQALAHLHAVLQVLGQAAEAHHLELPSRILRPQTLQPHIHFGDRRLVVLGVTDLWGLEHFHLEQAVVHGWVTAGAPIFPHPGTGDQHHA
jgi:hypothetical protein